MEHFGDFLPESERHTLALVVLLGGSHGSSKFNQL